MPDNHTRQEYQTRYKTDGRRHAVTPSLPPVHLRTPTPTPRAAPESRLLRPSSAPPRRPAPSAVEIRLRFRLARLVFLLCPPRPVPETGASFGLPRPVLLQLRLRLGPAQGIISEPRARSLPRVVPILGPPVPISQTRSLAGLPRAVFLRFSPDHALIPEPRPRATLPGPVLLLVRPLPETIIVARPGIALCWPLPTLLRAPRSLPGTGLSPKPPWSASLLSPTRGVVVEGGPGLSLHGPFLLSWGAVGAIEVLRRVAPEASPGYFASVLLPTLRSWTAVSDDGADIPGFRTSIQRGDIRGLACSKAPSTRWSSHTRSQRPQDSRAA